MTIEFQLYFSLFDNVLVCFGFFLNIKDKKPHIFHELVLYPNDTLLLVAKETSEAAAFLCKRRGSNFFCLNLKRLTVTITFH